MNRYLPAALVFVLLPASLLFADRITLSNGDRITGAVVKKDGDTLTVKGELTGEVKLKWKDVAAVEIEKPVTVVLEDKRTVTGSVQTAGDRIVLQGEQGRAEAPLASVTALRDNAEQRRYERLLNPPWTDLWIGHADFAIANASGNARTLTYNTALIAQRATRVDSTKLYFNQIFSRGLLDGVMVDTASAIRGGWAYNHNFSPRLFWSVFNDFEFDRFQSLDLRSVLGGGFGWNVVNREGRRLGLVGGGSWNREKFSRPVTDLDTGEPGFVRNAGEAFVGNDLAWRLGGISSLNQSFRMFNNLANTGEYRLNFDLGLNTQINRFLSWQITGSDRYLSNPAPGRKTNDLLISSGIRVTFSRMP